jgi:hypothetical protein
MGNPYLADFLNADGSVRFGGEVTFTDPGNQPGGGGSQPYYTRRGRYRWFDTIYPQVNDADGGTFTFTVNGETTAGIAFDADFAAMVAAIIALPGVTPDDVGIDAGPGNIGFALSFLTEPVTADASGLTGLDPTVTIVPGDRVVELFTLAENEILDNPLCQRLTLFDAATPGARLTESAAGEQASDVWSAPFSGAGSGGNKWDLSEGQSFARFAGADDSDSQGRLGARQVSYNSQGTPADWYVTLPTRAIGADRIIYLYVFAADWSAASAGEIEILTSGGMPA